MPRASPRPSQLPMKARQYIQGKTASATLGGQVKIESRFIGFIKDGVKFVIRVDEETNEIRIEL